MSSSVSSEMNVDLFAGGAQTLNDAASSTAFGTTSAETSMNLCTFGQCADGHGYELAGIGARVENHSLGADTTVKAWNIGEANQAVAPTYAGALDNEYSSASTKWFFSVLEEDALLSTYLINTASYDFTMQSLFLYDYTADSLLLSMHMANALVTCAPTCAEQFTLQANHHYVIIARTAMLASLPGDYDNEPYTGFYFAPRTRLRLAEPASLLLFGIGMLGLGCVKRANGTKALNS